MKQIQHLADKKLMLPLVLILMMYGYKEVYTSRIYIDDLFGRYFQQIGKSWVLKDYSVLFKFFSIFHYPSKNPRTNRVDVQYVIEMAYLLFGTLPVPMR